MHASESGFLALWIHNITTGYLKTVCMERTHKWVWGVHTSAVVHEYLIQGDPSLRGGNGIPSRCVYLEEMAADLDGQDWLDMDSIEQVSTICCFFQIALMNPSGWCRLWQWWCGFCVSRLYLTDCCYWSQATTSYTWPPAAWWTCLRTAMLAKSAPYHTFMLVTKEPKKRFAFQTSTFFIYFVNMCFPKLPQFEGKFKAKWSHDVA